MYVFTRVTGFLFIILGIFLILAGIAMGIYGAFQFITEPLPRGALPPIMAPVWFSLVGSFAAAIALFIQGLVTAALGQLMLIFVDIANNTRETASLLHRTRPESTSEVS